MKLLFAFPVILAIGFARTYAFASAHPQCSKSLSFISEDSMERLLKQKPPGFEIHLRQTAFYPDQIPGFRSRANPDVFHVDPFGNVFKPKDMVILDQEDRLLANLEILNEDSAVVDENGEPRKLREISYLRTFHSLEGGGDKISAPISKVELRGRSLVHFARSSIDRDGRLLASELGTPIMGMIDYLSSKHLRQLAENYEREGLPQATWLDLLMQEFALPTYRKFEIFVTYGPFLAGYLRFFDGTEFSYDERQRYGWKQPVVRLEYGGRAIGSVPTHLLPLERILFDPDSDENPVNSYRRDPRFRGFRFLEVGRAFLNYKQLSPDQVVETSKMLFTGSKFFLESLPETPPEKQLLFATGRKAAARLYEHEYGFMGLSESEMSGDQMRSVHDRSFFKIQDDLAVRLRFVNHIGDMGKIRDFDPKAPQKPIYVLGTTTDVWLRNLAARGLIVETSPASRWQSYPDDPRINLTQYLMKNPF